MSKLRTAPEIIADLFGTDIESVREMAYQPLMHRPAVYSWNDDPWSYLCCPPVGRKPPKSLGLTWEIIGAPWYDKSCARPVWGVRFTNTGF